MNYYVLSVWARRLIIIIFVLATLAWTIRQVSLTYKVWNPDPKPPPVVKSTPSVPEGAKTMGQNFLIHWFYVEAKEKFQDKQDRLSDYLSEGLKKQLAENPDLIMKSTSPIKVVRLDIWDEKWIKTNQKALVEYEVELSNRKVFHVQLPISKQGSWIVDGLPSLLPIPQVESNKELPSQPNIDDEELKVMEQVIDGFFDSWLTGRKDQNTKYIKNKPQNLLKLINGEYAGVTITPVQENPLIVRAIVKIRSGTSLNYSFEYRLSLKQEQDQYFVQKIIGGDY